MQICRASKLTALTRAAWLFVGTFHPPLLRLFLTAILPLSLLPPLMLYYAGTYHGDQFMPGFAARNWSAIAAVFFLAEMLTVMTMGRVIRWVARLNGVQAGQERSTLLAFAAPVPLWLSSLALFVPDFLVAATVGVLALGASCAIIYHGVGALLRVTEDVVAGAIAYGIMACGMMAWALLLLLVIPLG